MTALRRYAPFYIARLRAGHAGARLVVWPHLTVQSSANAFFVVYLLLEFRKFPKLTPGFLKKHAASTDEPTWIIVAVTFGAVMVAVGSLFVLINKGGQPNALELVLSLTAVALGWFSIHTMAALHYAHLYWRPERPGQDGRPSLDGGARRARLPGRRANPAATTSFIIRW